MPFTSINTSALSCVLAISAFVIASCSSPPAASRPRLSDEIIQVAPDAWNFEGSNSHTPYVPVGVNYDHDSSTPCNLLLEEYWQTRWEDVVGDFEETAGFGFNVVRIHLQLPQFMTGPSTFVESNLLKLDELVALARNHGLKLLITGLGNYRRSEVPAWFSALDDEATMVVEENFWKAIAARYPNEPAIFAYDLQNEPFVVSGDTDEVVGPDFNSCDEDGPGPMEPSGSAFVHNHFRHAEARWIAWVQNKYGTPEALMAVWPDYPHAGETWSTIQRPSVGASEERAIDNNYFANEMAALWTSRMTQAIRSLDSQHMITVAVVLPFQDRQAVEANEWMITSSFSPIYLKDYLDFISVHVYPGALGSMTSLDIATMIMRGAHVGKPVLLEETFVVASSEITDAFLARALDSVSGFVSFYWGNPPDVYRQTGGVIEIAIANWFDRYIEFVGNEVPIHGITRAPAAQEQTVSVSQLTLVPEQRAALSDEFSSCIEEGDYLDPILVP